MRGQRLPVGRGERAAHPFFAAEQQLSSHFGVAIAGLGPSGTLAGRVTAEPENAAVGTETVVPAAVAGDQFPAVDQEQVVWMFGTRRTGSTWLGFMLRDLPGGHKWGEPLLGTFIGDFYYKFQDKTGRNHIFSPAYRDLWQSWVRRLVCEGVAARAPGMASGNGYMVIRDPHGTVGAPILCECLPRSRLLILVRDPRDVVSSMADAHQSGGWMGEKAKGKGRVKRREGAHRAEADPVGFAKARTRRVVEEFEKAAEAYDTHQGPKTLVRYEDVRHNTAEEMARICGDLGIEASSEDIDKVVEEHSWDRVPEEEKGSGKFHRKASPGSWKDDLTPGQVKIIERVAQPVLDRFYPEWR